MGLYVGTGGKAGGKGEEMERRGRKAAGSGKGMTRRKKIGVDGEKSRLFR